MDTATVPKQPVVPLWGLNCLVVFQNSFLQYNPFFKFLKILLQFTFTPILKAEYYKAFIDIYIPFSGQDVSMWYIRYKLKRGF